MKQVNKFKRIAALFLVLAVSLTMIPGAVWADSSTDNDISNSKCIIKEIESFGDCEFNIVLKMENDFEVDGYMIYRAASKNGKYRLVESDIYSEIADVNVKKGKVYYYKARAYKKVDGKRIYSKYSSIVSKRAVPGPVYIDNLKISESGKVTGKILKNKIADGYYIYYATKEDGPYKLAKKVRKSNLKLNFSIPGEKYHYFIKIRGYINVKGKRYFGSSFGRYEKIAAENKVVNIANKELEEQVKEALGFSDLTKPIKVKDLLDLQNLTFGGVRERLECDDKDFSFLKYCINLEDITLYNCTIDKIQIICRALKDAPVREICISDTNIIDISPIKHLEQLETLWIFHSPIWDLSVIEQLPKLEKVEYYWSNRSIREGLERYYFPDLKGIKTACEKANVSYKIEPDVDAWCAADAVLDDFIEKEINPAMSDYEKIKAAHDFICKTVTYAYHDEFPGCKNFSPIYCTMIENHGVCEDYAMTFGYLTAKMGFETFFVHGYDSPTIEDDHAWNIIKLGDSYYHVDCTWDDPQNTTRYTYFLISDSTMNTLRDYKWHTDILPACPSDYKSAVIH